MQTKDIGFSYNQPRVLNKVTISIPSGKMTTILGPNGSGKSTLLHVMANNLQPETGEVLLDNEKITQFKPKELARRLAVVHQQNISPSDMTVERLVSFGRMPHRNVFRNENKQDQEAIEWAIESTNLDDFRNTPIIQLSGGERQRVWIAMALAQKTDMLFLDEPTTYLDIFYQLEILELVKKLNRDYGITILMVLHDINQAIQYSDELIVMKQGEVYETGRPDRIITRELIRGVYGVDAKVAFDDTAGMYILPTTLKEGAAAT
ncbi:iron complex transport system ATP-binding protein [Terribacillus halophilus]|uniref:Iron complex transport system ATP-binding protein n=1 Tax=Terribacillus halophilus TaxID=361279 RepID=A0A1G6LA75_9BACI|nr:ABC transporter ATP-binding protein [Terribacillus halophilus]SDC40091.1 iron complex transport system ATP-binding protein [Terribacillus halophilus]